MSERMLMRILVRPSLTPETLGRGVRFSSVVPAQSRVVLASYLCYTLLKVEQNET